jgi:hypothetical protein
MDCSAHAANMAEISYKGDQVYAVFQLVSIPIRFKIISIFYVFQELAAE